ncbi:MAG: aminotransferase class III-fold pyridoxal phosphate-dependent enzyme [Oligoflexia bacterium]|nr:aminotransferase class III-fold pyridoxal phosphate-dependent enzyme [Oligoflexia bacterium]
MTQAELFNQNEIVKKSIKTLKEQLLRAQESITGIRPPQNEKVEAYKSYISNLNQLRGRNLFYNYIGSGFGSGPLVELEDGSVKYDLINGIGIHLFGHSHPEVILASLEASLQDVVMQGNLQPNREYGDLLELLLKEAGKKSRLRKGWIGTCGTIANENALKIARQKNSPARKILAFKDCFAGRSTLMAEITDNDEYRAGLPRYDEVLYLPFYDSTDPHSTQKSVETLKKHVANNPKNIAAFMFEIVQGEGGFNTAPKAFFQALFEVCKEHKIAVWADEIQTFARTGNLFAFETLGIGEYIDIVTLAKTAQCGAVLYTEEYNPKPGLIAGTFTAATVSLKTGHKILQMMLDEKPGQKMLGSGGRVEKIHNEFKAMLTKLAEGDCRGLIGEIGGLGLMISMVPYDGAKDKVQKLLQSLFEKGVIAFSCGHGPYKIRFLLPAVLEARHIEEIGGVLKEALIAGRP